MQFAADKMPALPGKTPHASSVWEEVTQVPLESAERLPNQSPSGLESSPSRVFTSRYLMRRIGSIAASPRMAATS